VNGITFTGETTTGAAIMKAVAPTVKPISFELGGKNPGIVFADCDVDAAVAGMSHAIFSNTGQVCLAPERVYVERPIFDRFVAALKAKAEALVLGFPQDKATNVDADLQAAPRKVLSITNAKKEGAKVVTGGGVPKFGDAGLRRLDPADMWTGLSETSRTFARDLRPCAHIAPFDKEGP
jgi:aminomuconate-semialdehyde/2-hydroxymuconate-6-semialdehyde dehydrogenase